MSAGARVVARFGAELILRTQSGELRRAVARRNLARDQPPHLRAPLCGDFVRYEQGAEDKLIAVELLPRRNVLLRPDHRGRPLASAANIDQVFIVIAPRPRPDWRMLDRYLTAIAALPAAAGLLINKADLPEASASSLVEDTAALYRGLGLDVLFTSAHSGQGIARLRQRMQGKTSLLVGQSGVGKSSLSQALIPDLDIRIGRLSALHGSGRHTTSLAQLYALDSGGDLIDSPGVRDFSPYRPDTQALAAAFPEITAEASSCRFHDCRHRAEPGCAVKAAVAAGRIASSRLRHYLELCAEAGVSSPC